MRTFPSSVVEGLVLAITLMIAGVSTVAGQSMTSIPRPSVDQAIAGTRSLFLEVIINDIPAGVLAAFKETEAGGLTAAPGDLEAAGLKAMPEARQPDGRIHLDLLPGVAYRVEESLQRLHVTTTDHARVVRRIDARRSLEQAAPRADYGAVINYALFAATGPMSERDFGQLDRISGTFDIRLFGPYGLVNHSFIAGEAGEWMDDVVRLRTTWSYFDPYRMLTYRAGDLVSGALSWTRPVYLGGVQVQRNFGLRADVITRPLPTFAGSAALPRRSRSIRRAREHGRRILRRAPSRSSTSRSLGSRVRRASY